MQILTSKNIGYVMFGSVEVDLNELFTEAIKKYDHAYRNLLNIGLKTFQLNG